MTQMISKEAYDKLIAEGMPMIIDFSATWCGPCKKLSPIIDEIATEYAGKINVCKCDVDDNEELASMYGVRNIPTVIFIKNGQEVDRTVGAMPKSALIEHVQNLL